MLNLQHGFGIAVMATSTPAMTKFTESDCGRDATEKRARTVSVKNTGEDMVLLLINTAVTDAGLVAEFTNQSPIILDGGDSFYYPAIDAATGSWYRNIGYKAVTDAVAILISAF